MATTPLGHDTKTSYPETEFFSIVVTTWRPLTDIIHLENIRHLENFQHLENFGQLEKFQH